MKNGYKVIWSDESKFNLQQIINYLENNWTEREIKKFYKRLEKTISLISANPKLFRVTNKRKNVRKCVFSKQTSIYYKVIDKTIFIATLFDNRQNPKKLKL